MYSVVLYNYKISHSSTTQKIYIFLYTHAHKHDVYAKTNLITTNIYNYVIHIHFLKADTKIMLHSNTHSNITAPFSFLVSSDIILAYLINGNIYIILCKTPTMISHLMSYFVRWSTILPSNCLPLHCE